MGIHSSNQLSEHDIYVHIYFAFIKSCYYFVIVISYKFFYRLDIKHFMLYRLQFTQHSSFQPDVIKIYRSRCT